MIYRKPIWIRLFLLALVLSVSPDELWPQSTQSGETITIAFASFENKTDLFFYDRLETTLPEMLKTEMARSDQIVVLERSKLDAILAEQALAQAGLIDPETAQTVGRLAGAQFIVTGEITKLNKRLRIDARILRVANGQVLGEKVIGKDLDQIDAMVSVLANNIIFSLTGTGTRMERLRMHKYPTRWLLATGAAVGVGAFYAQYKFNDKYDAYKSARQLSEIQRHYDQANTAYQWRNWLLSASSSLMVTGAIFYLFDHQDDRLILANYQSANSEFYFAVIPELDCSPYLGVRLCFGF